MAGIQRMLIAATAAALLVNQAAAQSGKISDDVVKIGVLTDMSGQFSHESGEGAVAAVVTIQSPGASGSRRTIQRPSPS